MNASPDVIIIGAGIAGLSTAYELHRRGVSFVVLERASRPGGVILTEHIDGFTIDAGPDALLIQKPAAITLCKELGLGDRLFPTKPPRTAYILRGGRLYPLPEASVLGIPTRLGPLATTGLFTLRGKMRMAAELVVPRRERDEDESIATFMRRRFGDEAVTYLAEPLLAGIHAGDVDRLSMRALFPRLFEAERKHGSLIRAFSKLRRAHPPSNDGAFLSLPGGISEIVEALLNTLPTGSIRCGVSVRAIEGPGPFTVHTESSPPIPARVTIVATPAYVTADLLQALDRKLAELCAGVPYASTATVALAFPREAVANPLVGSGFVVPRVERTMIMAASWVSSKWPHRAPDGKILLRTFIGGARDPQAFARADADLVRLSEAELSTILGIEGRPLFTRVYRWERASAQHEVGHLDRLAAITRALECWPGLFVTGSGFRGVGIPDCVADGRATGACAADLLTRR